MDSADVLDNVRQIADRLAADRRARQLRTELIRSEFDELAEAGLPLSGVPADQGGLWESQRASTRVICELLRTLARGDSSLALVSAMHPSVLSFWLASPVAPEPYAAAWEAQRREHFEAVVGGAWWGTITSESGSGGDVLNTKARARPAPEATSSARPAPEAASSARPDGAGYRLSGAKQFGSGSGISSFMITVVLMG